MDNPFFQKIFPPDWSLMRAEFAAPAVREAIAAARKNLDVIRNEKNLGYESIIRALDRATMELDRVWTYVNHLESVVDTPELRDAVNALIPEVSEFSSSILLDDALYAQVLAYSKTPEAAALGGYKKHMLEETLLDFELEGAALPPEQKKRLTQIEAELSAKTQKFSENVLDSTKAFELRISDSADLKGLPQNAVDVARKKAAAENFDGWIFTLEQPSYVPFISYADSEVLREKIWRASTKIGAEGKFSNYGLIREILSLRDEEAKILKNADFADFILRRRMAKSGRNALDFVEKLRGRFYPYFLREWDSLMSFAKRSGLADSDKMKPWSAAYISEKFRKAEYGFDPEELRPYFPFENVVRGVFGVSEKLYGIKIEKCASAAPAWREDVQMYKMSASDGRLMGYFYADFFPHKEKRAGAWMNMLVNADAGVPALGVIAGNFSESADEAPALLSFDDVNTLFHEFGHLVHFFMMDCPEIGLRDVAWDFVELPSQIMENWCEKRECLDLFARHWQSGAKIPDSLFQKFRSAGKFMGANAAMRQISFAKIDLTMHVEPRRFIESADIEAEAREVLKSCSHEYSEIPPTILPRFTHIFGDSVGYAAGYYSYKWAEVLDADAFTRFEAEGIFNPKTGGEFAEKILRVGDTIEPEKAFENFMGRPPSVEALVRRSIDEAESSAGDVAPPARGL